jgi:hypothetical protein
MKFAEIYQCRPLLGRPTDFFIFWIFSFQNVVNLMVENISNTPKIHQTFV